MHGKWAFQTISHKNTFLLKWVFLSLEDGPDDERGALSRPLAEKLFELAGPAFKEGMKEAMDAKGSGYTLRYD